MASGRARRAPGDRGVPRPARPDCARYISFVLERTHAYGTIAAPIAALLFFFVLALGVLLGAEFNAAIEQEFPARVKQPRVLRSTRLAAHRAGRRPPNGVERSTPHACRGRPRACGAANPGRPAPGSQRERLS